MEKIQLIRMAIRLKIGKTLSRREILLPLMPKRISTGRGMRLPPARKCLPMFSGSQPSPTTRLTRPRGTMKTRIHLKTIIQLDYNQLAASIHYSVPAVRASIAITVNHLFLPSIGLSQMKKESITFIPIPTMRRQLNFTRSTITEGNQVYARVAISFCLITDTERRRGWGAGKKMGESRKTNLYASEASPYHPRE